MKNAIDTLPFDQVKFPALKSATWKSGRGDFYTFAPAVDSSEFREQFPDHKRVSGMLESSGSSWLEKAFVFCSVDCFDPPVYVQFGDSFEDAYESYCDNDESLVIDESSYADYGVQSDNPTCGFTSNGTPIDTESVQGFEITLVNVVF